MIYYSNNIYKIIKNISNERHEIKNQSYDIIFNATYVTHYVEAKKDLSEWHAR